MWRLFCHDTVSLRRGVGKDAIFYSTRADLGAVDADFAAGQVSGLISHATLDSVRPLAVDSQPPGTS